MMCPLTRWMYSPALMGLSNVRVKNSRLSVRQAFALTRWTEMSVLWSAPHSPPLHASSELLEEDVGEEHQHARG